jgi:glycosyltransferase involved in cell wall biosynthesis
MRIVIDMQSIQSGSRYRGIGRYSLNLVQAILRINKKHEIILILNALFPETIEPIRASFNGLISQENIRIWYSLDNLPYYYSRDLNRIKIAEKIRNQFIVSLCPDILLLTSVFEGYKDKSIISIDNNQKKYMNIAIFYDVIPLIYHKEYLDNDKTYKFFYNKKLKEILKANQFFTISKSSKNDISYKLNIKKSLIKNISGSIDHQFKHINVSTSEAISLKNIYKITKPFILYIGGSDFRKNLDTLIRCFSKLQPKIKSKFQLVLVGKISKSYERTLRSYGLKNDEVLFLDYVPDEHLLFLYNLCTLFVFPSCYEGFGLPLLEAMACGAPVIASRSPSLFEIIQDDKALFDPYNDDEIMGKIEQSLTDITFRKKLIQNGLRRAKLYSWNNSALKSLNFFEAIKSKSFEIKNFRSFQLANIKSIVRNISKKGLNLSDNDLKRVAASISLNHPLRKNKYIYIDISELVHRDAGTGIQRVTRNILNELLICPPAGYEIKPVFATIANFGYRNAYQFLSKFNKYPSKREDDPIEPIAGDIFLGLDLQHHTTRVQSGYLHLLRNHGVAVYFVIYDLLPIQFPQYWPEEHSVDKVHAEWLNLVVQFDGLICISKSVADELLQWLNIQKLQIKRLRPLNVGWFHLGADINKTNLKIKYPENFNFDLGSRINFLMVGTIEPRKGYALVLDTFDYLWDRGFDLNLVIVGRSGWLVDVLINRINQHPRKGVNLFWFKNASDSLLQKLYVESDCLIAASEGEGFGLPLIEAAQYQLPIIARDIPVFREVAESYPLFFSEKRGSQLRFVIRKWISDVYSKKKKKKVFKYLNWAQSAKQLTNVIIKNNWYQIW